MPPDAPEPTDSADVQRRRRSLAIVAEAYDVPPADRAAFLDRECGGDGELRRIVEAMLDFDERSLSILDQGLGSVFDLDGAPPVGIDGYRVVGELGRGGMGVVYAAERTDGAFEKTVALKVVRAGLHSQEAVRRFERERKLLARLDHPGIARLLDGGVTETGPDGPEGVPYFIMERVDGEPLTTYAEDRQLGLADRLALALDACDAVAHAHRLLVVHRDLKPSNVFVAEDETGTPRVKLLDFGIAKALDEDDDDLLTRTGGALTPAYAAPEQVAGEPITAATDVYALGVMLYELLVGKRPYAFPSHAPAEVARVVREQAPTRPSDAVATVEAPAEAPPEHEKWSASSRALRGDLDAIILQALRKEPERRYATAGELAEDLRRYVDGRPVEARGDSLGYRASRFVRRHKGAVAAAAALTLALAGGIAAVLWQARETAREATRANATLEYVLGMFESVDPVELEGGDMRPADLLAPGLRQAAALDRQPLVQASLLEGLGRLGLSLGEFPTADSVLAKAVEVRRRAQGAGHADVAIPLTWLAQSLTAQRRYEEGVAAGEEAVRLLRGARRPNDLAEAQIALAEIHYRQYESDASKALYREAIRNATEPAQQTAALLGLANELADGDSLEAALPLYRRATALARRAFGPTDPRTADALYDFAEAESAGGHAARADSLHRAALAVYERAYGRGDYRTAQSLYTLAVLHHDDPATAEPFYRQALAAYERSALGDDHLWREYTRVALGGLLLDTGRAADAFPLLDAGASAFADDLGDDDDRTLLARARRAVALVRLGREAEGLRALRSVAADAERLAPQGASRPGILGTLADVLDETGRSAEAAEVRRQRAALEGT